MVLLPLCLWSQQTALRSRRPRSVHSGRHSGPGLHRHSARVPVDHSQRGPCAHRGSRCRVQSNRSRVSRRKVADQL